MDGAKKRADGREVKAAKRRIAAVREPKAPKHALSLGDEIAESRLPYDPRQKKEREKTKRRKIEEDTAATFVDDDITEKILHGARQQLLQTDGDDDGDDARAAAADGAAGGLRAPRRHAAGLAPDDDDEEDEPQPRRVTSGRQGLGPPPVGGDEAEEDQQEGTEAEDADERADYERATAALEAITADDEAALELFMGGGGPAAAAQTSGRQQRGAPAVSAGGLGGGAMTLADLILEKIREREQQQQDLSQLPPDAAVEQALGQRLDQKVLQVYKGVGKLLASYTSGPLPKAFKLIPALSNWEEVLWLTDPPSWTPAAAGAATRIFASNLNAKMAQRFYNLVLLPVVRQDIKAHRRLNFHLYLALKKALFKSTAFYKGILLPLAESGQCTLREATIVGSVLSHVSVPVLDSSVAILKLAQMPYSGANSVFLRVLLNKKYALPYRVVHAVVQHFISFRTETRQLPVLWHQALLVFVQRYKNDLLPSERDALLALLRHVAHPVISEDVRRELTHSVPRGAPVATT